MITLRWLLIVFTGLVWNGPRWPKNQSVRVFLVASRLAEWMSSLIVNRNRDVIKRGKGREGRQRWLDGDYLVYVREADSAWKTILVESEE